MNDYDPFHNPIDDYLEPDEKIIWRGKPARKVSLSGGDVFLIPFSIIWCGFAILWTTAMAASGAPVFFWLFGVPFIILGLYFVFGRFIHVGMAAARTFYALTDKRIMIVTGLISKRFTSLDIRDIPVINLRLRRGGVGDIQFGNPSPFMEQFANFPNMCIYGNQIPAFKNIENVEGMFNEIRELKRRATSQT